MGSPFMGIPVPPHPPKCCLCLPLSASELPFYDENTSERLEEDPQHRIPVVPRAKIVGRNKGTCPETCGIIWDEDLFSLVFTPEF